MPPSKGPASPIKVYSCDLCILDSVGDSMQVTCMTIGDWCQAQWSDLVLGLVIARLQDGTLGQPQLKPTDPPELQQFLHESNDLKLRQGILYRKILPKESQEALFQLVLSAMHRETALIQCHNEVGHLGRHRADARPNAQLLLLALHGCTGEGTHWQMPSMPHL